jgi:hypothetical protein
MKIVVKVTASGGVRHDSLTTARVVQHSGDQAVARGRCTDSAVVRTCTLLRSQRSFLFFDTHAVRGHAFPRSRERGPIEAPGFMSVVCTVYRDTPPFPPTASGLRSFTDWRRCTPSQERKRRGAPRKHHNVLRGNSDMSIREEKERSTLNTGMRPRAPLGPHASTVLAQPAVDFAGQHPDGVIQ